MMNMNAFQFRVEVRKCPSFIMHYFPEAREFIENDIQSYKNVFIKTDFQRDEPAICLTDNEGQVFREEIIGKVSRRECNSILHSFGGRKIDEDGCMYEDVLDRILGKNMLN